MWIWTVIIVAECIVIISLFIRKILKMYESYKYPNMDILN